MRADVAEAVFLPGSPPRQSRLALWGTEEIGASPSGTVELALPTKTGVRRRAVPARLLGMAAVLELLTRPQSEHTTASLRAWAAAALTGVGLVARGRLQPSVTPDGHGAWRAGPLDAADVAWLHQLAEAMPPLAHAVPLGNPRPLRVHTPVELVGALWDAIADTLVRTAAAPATVGSAAQPFAAADAQVVVGAHDWLIQSARADAAGARVMLRIEPPDEDDVPFLARLQLRSVADPSLIVDAADLWSAPAAVLRRLGGEAETDLLLGLRRGARVFPALRAALAQAAPVSVPLDDRDVDDLLEGASETLEGAGVDVLWPAELFAHDVRLVASAAVAAPAGAPAGFTLNELLEFQWRPTLDGQPLTDEEVAQLAEAKRPVVRLRGRWVRVDHALLARLRGRVPRRLTAAQALAAALSGSVVLDGEPMPFSATGPLADLVDRLRTSGAAPDVPVPAGLQATLRPYQRRGLAWLAQMTSLGLGACLADDMGLGKTIQLIALHLHRGPLRSGPTLVVCPTSLLGNWQRELARFAPDVPVRRYHGGTRHVDELAADEVVLVTYGVLRRDRAALAEVPWGLVVADEAQHAKNPNSRTAKELRALPAAARVALSGTPVENRLSELWALLDWTTPGLLGSLEHFRNTLAVPVERYRDPDATERLSRIVRPFLLRRRKSDPGIAPELPAKTETDRVVPLTSEQATLYQAVVAETLAKIRESEGIARRGLVLSLITGLKLICNHPAQFLHEPGPLPARSGKLAALDELLEVVLAEGESALVFSQYVEMGRLLERHLSVQGVDALFLHGGVTPTRREEMVDAFQSGAAPVFLLSLKAGGVGLNLTRATHVIHYDRWWNPAVEDQATDRAYRIGQDHPVQVHRLVTEGTVEDRVATLLAAKRDLADAVVGQGEAWVSELDDDALADLVRLGEAS